MDRILARLERKLGRFAIERLPTFIVGGMAIVFILGYVRPDFIELLTLDPHLALNQPWRFVTYLFIPESWSLFWIFFTLYFTWLIGTNLEHEWGAFKFNVYYLVGALGTTAAAWLTGGAQGSFWISTSLFFAFATIFPNYEILLFFIVPVRVKWLALFSFAFVVFKFVTGGLSVKVAIVVALANYLLFFGGYLITLARGQKLQMSQAVRRTSLRAATETEARATKGGRACAICGVRQADGADIRVCSCEKCGTPRELCLDHARNH